MKKPLPFRLVAIALAAVALVAVTSCSTAKIKDVWTAPDLTRFNFKKVLVVAAAMDSQDGVRRRTAEDSIVHALSSIDAVPSYAYFAENDFRDAAKSSAAIKAAGYDGVIVMRLISARTEITASRIGVMVAGGMAPIGGDIMADMAIGVVATATVVTAAGVMAAGALR